jgi:hypothetical protein
MLSEEQVGLYLRRMEAKLMAEGNRKKVRLSTEWVNGLPDEPDAYLACEARDVVYVGETGNLRARMRDLLDSRRHSLRRSIGKHNFSMQKDYHDATTRRKFPKHIENSVVTWLQKKVSISLLPMKLGRKELEEKLIHKYDPKYNKRRQRKTR